MKAEIVEQLPSKAPFSKRFEDAVGEAFESAAARRVAKQFDVAATTVRSIDLRYLEHWAARRHKPALRQLGVDEIHLGKKQKFLTVASNLESGEPLWFGRERKKETPRRVLRYRIERPAKSRHRGGLRKYVGAFSAEHRAVDSPLPHRL